MSAPAISIEGISKLYRIGEAASDEYQTLRESICAAALRPLKRWRKPQPSIESSAHPTGTIAALDDVSLEVREGEVLGVIGRNGAGKSTLLKILSRITQPTSGRIRMRGRVGSLLEVGTGFHPELTGRENIFLNGAILGMPNREIARKFDQIVDFAEVERFLDTPVKRYSSGMYMRLAFAVASHLEPEIMIVDEVLAVGDAQFQKKCLGRMNDVSREGRTVLFVSHNMSAIKSLCTRGVLMEAGRVAYLGSIDETVNRYLSPGSGVARAGVIPADAHRHRDVPDEARLTSVRLTTTDGTDVQQLFFGQPFRIAVACEVIREIIDGHFEISISTTDGTHV